MTGAAADGLTVVACGPGVRIALDDGRPVNVLALARLAALERLLDGLAAHPRPAFLLVAGNGRGSFAAGADLREIAALDSAGAWSLAQAGQRVFRALAGGPWPTGALVDGHALGGGFDLALACDVLVATPGSRFAHPGLARGFFTGWGGTQRTAGRARPGRGGLSHTTAAELSARRARALGLVSAVAPRRAAERELRRVLTLLAGWGAARLAAWRAGHNGQRTAALARALDRLGRVDTP